MKLLKPDTGEVLDRLSILYMKGEAEHFNKEAAELIRYLGTKTTLETEVAAVLLALGTINGRIWELTNKTRALPGSVLAWDFIHLNDSRATVIRRLTGLLEKRPVPSEKV